MVQCRVNKLGEWIKDKNRFDGISMIRLVKKDKHMIIQNGSLVE